MQDLAMLRKETHAALCLACGKCSTMCPLSPSGWFSAARMVAIRDPEAEVSGQTQSLNACLTCGSCEIRCPEGVHFIDFVRGVRGLAPASERRPCPHGEMLQSAARLMAGRQAPTRDFTWLSDDLETADKGEIALFVGCLPFYDILFEREFGIQTLEIARSAIRLLNRVGIRPVLLAEERCCGHDLLWNGEKESFQALAEANTDAFKERGVEHILTTCGECCRTWRLDYPETVPAYRPKVEHISEFLAARIEAGELVANSDQSRQITFQDPCRLGRHLEVTEAPRQVLRALGNGSGLVEMEHSGRDAVCCGTSGFIHCDANSRRLQSERLASAEATGADTLATACPKCLIHFHCAQDLTVLAALALARAESASAEPEPTKSTQQRIGEA
jgi:Fe-S oxidoreductase